MPITAATASDLEILETQLGRTPRGVAGIGARCICGRPLVVATLPRLDDGTPFPTFFYLSSPQLVLHCSRLEATGRMQDFQRELAEDADFAKAYTRAHRDYLTRREAHGQVPEITDVSAGGMPTRVKCLHALVAHALAAGEGVNPVGDRVLAELAAQGTWSSDKCHCHE